MPSANENIAAAAPAKKNQNHLPMSPGQIIANKLLQASFTQHQTLLDYTSYQFNL